MEKARLILLSASLMVVNCGIVEDVTQKLVKTVAECAAEIGTTPDEVLKIMSSDPPERYETKCLMFCFNKKYGIQNTNGKFNNSGAISSLSRLRAANPAMYKKVAKLLEKCVDEVSESMGDKCEAAWSFFKCAKDNRRSVGLSGKSGMLPL